MKSLSALTSLVAFLVSSVAAHDYAINLHQPLKVGQRYEFTVIASDYSENSMTSEQHAPKNRMEELSVEMESVATVLEVDTNGRPTKESHTIVKLLVGAKKEPMLTAGTEVGASRPGRKVVFEIEGKPATGAVAKALELAVEITSGGPTDDEIFGTKERKKVGDSWPVNEVPALKDANEKLSASGLKVASLKGTTTLQKASNDGGVEAIHLLANLTATISPAAKGPYSSVKATMNAEFYGAFPEDIAKRVRKEGMTRTLILEASGKPNPQGPLVQISGRSKRSITRQYKLLK